MNANGTEMLKTTKEKELWRNMMAGMRCIIPHDDDEDDNIALKIDMYLLLQE